MRRERSWLLVVLMLSPVSCGSTSVDSQSPEKHCTTRLEPAESRGNVLCETACARYALAATCEGPAGKPVACACSAGPRSGHTFALDDCRSLDADLVIRNCGQAD